MLTAIITSKDYLKLAYLMEIILIVFQIIYAGLMIFSM